MPSKKKTGAVSPRDTIKLAAASALGAGLAAAASQDAAAFEDGAIHRFKVDGSKIDKISFNF